MKKYQVIYGAFIGITPNIKTITLEFFRLQRYKIIVKNASESVIKPNIEAKIYFFNNYYFIFTDKGIIPNIKK